MTEDLLIFFFNHKKILLVTQEELNQTIKYPEDLLVTIKYIIINLIFLYIIENEFTLKNNNQAPI